MKFFKLFCLCSALAACCLRAAGQQHLTSTWGATLNVSLLDTITHLNIPVELKQGITAEQLEITLYPVKSDKVPNNVAITAFTCRELTDIGGKKFIVVDINNRPVVKPGIYQLEFRIKKRNPNPDSTIQSLPISLTVNAAEVKAISTVIITRKDGFFFFPYKMSVARLQIQESGKKMPLDTITIRTLKTINAANENVPGIIRISASSPRVGPGGLLDLDFDILGKLPLGKVTTTAELTAPQLPEPVSITVEVTTRRGIYLIIIIIILGLAIGFLVRTFLESRITLSTARLNAIELLRVIAVESKNRKDLIFLNAVNAIKEKLNIVMQGSKDGPITTEVTDSTGKLTAAINDHNARRVQVEQSLNELLILIRAIAKLPDHFKSVSGNAESLLLTAKQVNASGDAASANISFEQIKNGFETRFSEAVKNFRSQVQKGINSFDNSLFTLVDLKPRIASIKLKLDEIEQGLAAKADMGTFEKIYNVDLQVNELLSYAGGQIFNNLLAVTNILKDKPLNNVDALNTLTEKSAKILEQINAGKEQTYSLFETFSNELNDLQEKFKLAMMAQTEILDEQAALKSDNDKDRKAIEASVNGGRYLEAANAVVIFLRRNHQRNLAVAGKSIVNTLSNFTVNPPQNTFSIFSVTTELQTPPDELQNLFLQTQSDIRTAKLWQTILSGLVILLIGCALYADSFIGTPMDIASVFMWAFLLDISVATITGGLGARVAKK